MANLLSTHSLFTVTPLTVTRDAATVGDLGRFDPGERLCGMTPNT
jgi:hypothetical protein